jgi:putative transposase
MRTDYHQKFYEGCFYHVYNRTINRAWLFANDENYRYFLKRWGEYLNKYTDTYAYCLMTNHYHFLIRVKTVDEHFKQQVALENTSASRKFLRQEITISAFLEDQFKRFFNAYAGAFNKQQGREGSLFQQHFKRVQITDKGVLLEKICYVHHNPIHHGITPFYEVWRFSSYQAYLSDIPTQIARHSGLCLFNTDDLPDVQLFKAYHEDYRLRQLKK